MSLGLRPSSDPDCNATPLHPLCTALALAQERDVLQVAAAGNDGTNAPAHGPTVFGAAGRQSATARCRTATSTTFSSCVTTIRPPWVTFETGFQQPTAHVAERLPASRHGTVTVHRVVSPVSKPSRNSSPEVGRLARKTNRPRLMSLTNTMPLSKNG